ncbi:MAG: hypothetical protein E3J65_00555 [Dehalococcoidia bacterium]|nr:MAG: hypothetical protein E3J65_00555 [Dehalococcoidia bacterium]
MVRLVRVELFKVRKRGMTWILLAVLVAFFCMIFLGMYAAAGSAPHGMPGAGLEALKASLQFPNAFDMIFSTAQGIGGILLVILAASAVGNEYGWGTVRQMLSKRGIRSHYLGAKIVSLIIIALIGIAISLIVGFALASFTTIQLAGSINWDFMSASYVGELFKMFGWTAFALLVYILLGVLFAVVGRSALVGIAVGLGYYFVERIAIGIFTGAGGWLAEIPNYLIGQNINALMPGNQLGGPFMTTSTLPSLLHASVTLAVYCLVFLALSLYLFQKRDLTA